MRVGVLDHALNIIDRLLPATAIIVVDPEDGNNVPSTRTVNFKYENCVPFFR